MDINTLSRDELIMKWEASRKALEAAKASELELRNAVKTVCFPDALEGTSRIELGNGYELKCVAKLNYTLADNDKVEAALDRLEKTGNEGAFLAPRLVNWKPSLSLSEYRDLAPQYKAIIDDVLTVKPGTPTIDIVEPKGK
jgi:hypothetical protein